MEKQVYITEEERAKCQKVADAFVELYEIENILVVDVKLQYYKTPHGFENAVTFTDSRAMFEDLWQEWLDTRLYMMAKGTPLMEGGYEGVFKSLTKEKQSELIERNGPMSILWTKKLGLSSKVWVCQVKGFVK